MSPRLVDPSGQDVFLASFKTVSEMLDTPEFLRLAEETASEIVRRPR
jgi:hypothetical protein